MNTKGIFQNPLKQIDKAADELAEAHKQTEDALLPEKPLNQKRFIAWEKTKRETESRINSSEPFGPTYTASEAREGLSEISQWTIKRIKEYIMNNRWDYGKYRKTCRELSREEIVRFEICRSFIFNYHPEICDVDQIY